MPLKHQLHQTGHHLDKHPAIEVKDLTVKYSETFNPVFKDLDFTIEKGQLVMVIGPNGSGKTTLIKSILGLMPYQGSIKLEGRDIHQCPHAIGYVPQTHTIDLSFPMTVTEFLKVSHANCPDYVNRQGHIRLTLEKIGAKPLEHQPLSSLSGGQLQRVLLARAIMHQPHVLILDEPEAGIDVGGEQTLYDLLVKLKEHRITILVSTHEIDIVEEYADKVVCLNRRLICYDTPQAALTEETLKQLYGAHYHHPSNNHH